MCSSDLKVAPLVPSHYVPGPDMNMGEEEMAIFQDVIGTPKAATGKPADRGGLPHELGSTGYGVFLATEVALGHAKIPMAGATVALWVRKRWHFHHEVPR